MRNRNFLGKRITLRIGRLDSYIRYLIPFLRKHIKQENIYMKRIKWHQEPINCLKEKEKFYIFWKSKHTRDNGGFLATLDDVCHSWWFWAFKQTFRTLMAKLWANSGVFTLSCRYNPPVPTSAWLDNVYLRFCWHSTPKLDE